MKFASSATIVIGLLGSLALGAADVPKIVFSKDFKGATPPLFIIEVSKDGSAVYKEGLNDEQPIAFTIPPGPTGEIFGYFEKVGNGKKELESGLKVANLGKKTFRYINGSETNEVSFNYSLDADAQALADMFERLSETQQHLFNLERTVRFDKLGVNKVLLQIETSYDRHRLIGVHRFLPLLERVVKNDAYLNMARERAAKLAEVFRNPPPAAAHQAAANTP